MKTDTELESIVLTIRDSHTLLDRDAVPKAVKILRSIELDAWQEARELVDKLSPYYSSNALIERNEVMAEMDRIIQQLQLK